jgi:hypothetical protein
MFLVSALLVSAGIGLVSGAISGASNKKKADQQRELLDKQKEQQKLQLDQTKASNRQNALDTSSYFTLNTAYSTENLESELSEYENQVNLYASQAQRSVGSANASTALTGFRRSGSNLNAVKNTQSDVLSQMKSVYSNIQQTRLSNGQSLVNMQTNAMSNLAGYKQNVTNAIDSYNAQIDYLNLQRDQLGYENGWSIVKDAGMGALSGATSYVTGGLVSNGNPLKKSNWTWS